MKATARDIPQPVPEFTPFVLTIEVETQDELDQLYVLSCTRVIDEAFRVDRNRAEGLVTDHIYRALLPGHDVDFDKRHAYADRLKAAIQKELEEEMKARIRDALSASGLTVHPSVYESFYD